MLGIKGRIKRFLSLTTILAMLLMGVPSMAATDYDFEGKFDITAGQNTVIGEAIVTIEDNMLTVDVDLEPGQEAKEYQLYILDSIPTERLSPGQADEKDTFNPEQEDFQIGPIQIDLDELDPGQCQDLYLMLHLAVGTETAYAGDIVNPDRGAWFGYIHIQICEPDDPDPEFGSLTIFKFHDLNENGEFDEDDEQALSGIEFEIYNEDDEALDGSPFTTDENGLIELTNLPVGEYTIKELSDYQITGQVFADGLLTIFVSSNDTTDVEIGNVIPEPTYDFKIIKFADLDEDGEMQPNGDSEGDPAEYFLSGIHFELYASPDDDEPIAHGYTNQNGELIFEDLEEGSYYLKELSDYEITTPQFNQEDFYIIEVEDEDDSRELWVGNFIDEETGSITVWKFEDKDKDGEWDENEPALEDVEFKLYKVHYPVSEASMDDVELVTIGSGFTDENGKLVFDNLTFGDYALEEHSSFEITTPNALKDGLLEIELHEEDGDQEFEVGNFIPDDPESEPGTIKVWKFNDTDRDGNWDEGETTLSGIGFELFEAMNDDEPIASGVTDANGTITFSGLEPGDYFLDELGNRIITTGVNGQGFIEVPDLDEGETRDVEVGNYRETPPPPPPTRNDDDDDDDEDEDPVEFGTLRIQKFLDSDEDGIFDTDEFSMVGITFELYDAEGDDLISTKVTDSEGVITFPNLEFGEYYLREVSDFRITTEGFDADGFSSDPIEIDSDDVLIITVGNIRDEVPAAVVVELPAEIEIVEEPIPLALPDTGEAGVESYYILGSLIMIAGMFLKRLR